MNKALLGLLLLCSAFHVCAQTTYYSKPTATDFNNVNSWGTATNGTGTSPAGISSADIFVVANGASLTLSAKATVRCLYIGSVTGFLPSSASGTLTLSASDSLIVSLPAGNNATLGIGTLGTLNVSGGTVILNGNMNHLAGQFTQSGGNIIVDGNSGTLATSVVSGTSIVKLSAGLTLSGGMLTVVDPTAGSSSSGYALEYSGSSNIIAANAHVVRLGDGVSTTPGGVTDGFVAITCNASSACLKLGSLVIAGGSGTNRWAIASVVNGDLTINSGSEYRTLSPYSTIALGNIINNGILTTTTSLELNSANPQTVSGTGIFRNNTNPASVTANFVSLSLGNTSQGGVTFVGTSWSSEQSTISSTLTTVCRINMPAGDTFTVGTSAANPGYVYSNTTSGFTGGTLRRWLGTSGSQYGTFPFVSPTPAASNANRGMFVSTYNGTTTTFGLISITYSPAPGNSYVTPFYDNGSRVTMVSNDKWSISQSGFNMGTSNWYVKLYGTGLNSYPTINGIRVTGLTGPIFTSAVTSASGTATAPYVEKANIAASDIGATPVEIHFGSQHVFNTISSGNWETDSVWEGGFSPGLGCESVLIQSGNTVTVGVMPSSASSLTINSGGTLAVSGNTLTVGCGTARNASLMSNGTLTISGGQLLVNGNVGIAGGNLTQTGGLISVDGNDQGLTSSSITTADLVAFESGTAVNLSGGTFRIVDPTAGTNTTYYTLRTNLYFAAGGMHTFQFGDGVSTDATGNASGMTIKHNYNSKFNDLIINNNSTTANKRNVTGLSGVTVAGNMTIMSGGSYTTPSGTALAIAGNIVNNGTLTSSGSLSFVQDLTSFTPVQVGQTLSGTGIFQNAATSPTANFAGIYINNNSAGGVTFSGSAWNSLSSTASSSLGFGSGGSLNRFNIGTAIFTLGTSASAPGSLSWNSGGFTSGTFKRWIGTAAITYSDATGLFPFVAAALPAANALRNVSISLPALTNGGTVSIKHTAGPGINTVTPFTDNGATIQRVTNSSWAIGQSGLTPTSSAFGVRITGEGTGFATNPYLTRITGATSSALTVSSTDTGGGSPLAPQAFKTGTTVSSFTVPALLYLGLPKTIVSAQSGAYESTGTWTGGIVPGSCDEVVIDNGHIVTVNATAAASGNLFINTSGSLMQTGSTLTVGCGTARTALLTNAGSLNISGGSLAVNGAYTQYASGAALTQSGGAITLDGNNGGVAATSLRGTSPLLSATAGSLNLSGGTLTIVDPPALAGFTPSLYVTLTGAASGSHTLQLGDGISTDAGLGTAGMYLTATSYKFRNLTANNGASSTNNRWAAITDNFSLSGNVTLLSGGELRNTTSNRYLYIEGNLSNSGMLVIGSGGYLGFTGFAAQTLSGSGIFAAGVGSTSVAFSGLYFNNSSAGGVTLSGSGWHAWPITVTDNLRFGSALNRVNIGTDTFTLGSSGITGVVTMGSGGFTGGTFRRWVGTSSVAITSSTGLFPFVNAASPTTNNIRNMNIGTNGNLVGGYAAVTYLDSAGVNAVTPFTDNGSTIAQVSNASWLLSHTFGPPPVPYAQYNITGLRITGQGLSSVPLTQGLRITGTSASVLTVGPNDYGSGTDILPQANKTGLAIGDIPRASAPIVLRFGIDKSFHTAQSGAWAAGSTWAGGVSPGAGCDNVVINAGHAVTVSSGTAGAKNLAVLSGGNLAVGGGSLTVGCDTIRNYQLYNAGGLAVSGGTLTVNGAIINIAGNSFSQSGGGIVIDPNDRGNPVTSTAFPAIAFPAGGSSYSLTGGTITVADPLVPSAGVYRFLFNSSVPSRRHPYVRFWERHKHRYLRKQHQLLC